MVKRLLDNSGCWRWLVASQGFKQLCVCISVWLWRRFTTKTWDRCEIPLLIKEIATRSKVKSHQCDHSKCWAHCHTAWWSGGTWSGAARLVEAAVLSCVYGLGSPASHVLLLSVGQPLLFPAEQESSKSSWSNHQASWAEAEMLVLSPVQGVQSPWADINRETGAVLASQEGKPHTHRVMNREWLLWLNPYRTRSVRCVLQGSQRHHVRKSP